MKTRLIALLALGLATVAPAATVIFKQGAINPLTSTTYTGTEDAWLFTDGPSSGTSGRNTGGDGRIAVGGKLSAGFFRHQLMRFDVTSLAGAYSSIDSVTLRLYWHPGFLPATFADGPDTIRVHQIASANSGWVEGTAGPGTNPSPGPFSTWDSRVHSGTPWAGSAGASTAGTDYLTPIIASAAYDQTEIGNEAFDLVFTDVSFLPTWIAGSNPGLFLRTATEDKLQAIFHSSESPTDGFAWTPELIVNYTAVPEPSRATLMLLALGGIVLRRRRR